MVQAPFWKNRKVLVTGHTGFKGGWLSTWLLGMGARVVGYALEPDTEPCFFNLCGLAQKIESITGDIRHQKRLRTVIAEFKPEIVFHLAAQSLVRYSYEYPVDTFAVNVMGTVNLLESVRDNSTVRAVIVVTSDKCYENQERSWGYKEEERLGGRDPYSASKACAEIVTSAYSRSLFTNLTPTVRTATVRSGNVIGGGDWGRDRLFPDVVRAVQRGNTPAVRNPVSIRPWQHVLEPLAGYLMLAERLFDGDQKFVGAWNFGPCDKSPVSVGSLCDMITDAWDHGGWRIVPGNDNYHEAHFLALDSSKAENILGWHPRLTLREAVTLTADWYKRALSNTASGLMYDVTREQIRLYMERSAITQKV